MQANIHSLSRITTLASAEQPWDLVLEPLCFGDEEALWFVVPAHGKCWSVGSAEEHFDLLPSEQELISSQRSPQDWLKTVYMQILCTVLNLAEYGNTVN